MGAEGRVPEAWLANLCRNRRAVKRLFAHRGGNEWMVSQCRLRRRYT